jgi:hypothetical protein
MAIFGLTNHSGSGALSLVALGATALWWLAEPRVSRSAAMWLPLGVAFVTLLASYTSVGSHSVVSRYWFTDQLRSPAPLDPTRLYLGLYLSPQSVYREDLTGMPFGATTRPGSTSMFGGVHLINGYSPVSPAGIGRLLDFGTHGQINPAKASEIVLPEAGSDGLLAQLGIDGIILDHHYWLEEPLPNDWESAFSDEEAQVFHRRVPLRHVRVLGADESGGAAIRLLENSRQHVVAEITPNDSARAVRIVFSRPYFPGYYAKLNNRALPVRSLQGLAPVVEVPAGQSGRLELVYRPRSVTVGGSIAGLTLLALAVSAIMLRRRVGLESTGPA